MKKTYETPELFLWCLCARDVIADSLVGDEDEDFQGGDIIIIG